MQSLTLPDDGPDYHEAPSSELEANQVRAGNPQFVLVGFIGLLALLWLVRKKSGLLQQEALGINLFNLLVITITAVVGISLFKILFARFPIPGITQLVAAV